MLQQNKIYLGDNIELLKQLETESIHSVVSDFPYNLNFMGKSWDTISNFYDWNFERATELLRVLKHGGYCLIFGSPRTHHRMVCAFEDAGFEIRDEIQWIYGSGMPKSYNISKGFDKKAGVEREVINIVKGMGKQNPEWNGTAKGRKENSFKPEYELTAPSTDLAKQWDGFGTSLKPAQEPIMVAQKPIQKNYCYNVEKYGVGGLNIDDSRISTTDKMIYSSSIKKGVTNFSTGTTHQNPQGRFPSNIIFNKESAEMLDQQTGTLKSGSNCTRRKEGSFLEHGGLGKEGDIQITYGDSGGASRFFYCAKSSKKDKTENGEVENTHPTVKPTELIKYLVRLVTPKNGISLDICLGSGTHSKACIQLTKEDYPVNYIGFENEESSFDIASKRILINIK